MLIGRTIRICDLAKYLKQDTKRLIEELRREGADVSVPSQPVSRELAERICNRYFPKNKTVLKRTLKTVKKELYVETENQIEQQIQTSEIKVNELRTKKAVKQINFENSLFSDYPAAS